MKKFAIIAVVVCVVVFGGLYLYIRHEDTKKQTGTETQTANADSTNFSQPNLVLRSIVEFLPGRPEAVTNLGDTVDVSLVSADVSEFLKRVTNGKSAFCWMDKNKFSAEHRNVITQLFTSINIRKNIDRVYGELDDRATGEADLYAKFKKQQSEINKLRNRVKKLETASSSDGLPETQPGEGRDHPPTQTGGDGLD